jgi:hypothetical protein
MSIAPWSLSSYLPEIPPGVVRALEPFELPTQKFPGVSRALGPFEKFPDVDCLHPAIEFADLESALA